MRLVAVDHIVNIGLRSVCIFTRKYDMHKTPPQKKCMYYCMHEAKVLCKKTSSDLEEVFILRFTFEYGDGDVRII